MRYLKVIWYIRSIKKQTNLPIGKIIVNAMKNTGMELDTISDGWLWSVLQRYDDKCK